MVTKKLAQSYITQLQNLYINWYPNSSHSLANSKIFWKVKLVQYYGVGHKNLFSNKLPSGDTDAAGLRATF